MWDKIQNNAKVATQLQKSLGVHLKVLLYNVTQLLSLPNLASYSLVGIFPETPLKKLLYTNLCFIVCFQLLDLDNLCELWPFQAKSKMVFGALITCCQAGDEKPETDGYW